MAGAEFQPDVGYAAIRELSLGDRPKSNVARALPDALPTDAKFQESLGKNMVECCTAEGRGASEIS